MQMERNMENMEMLGIPGLYIYIFIYILQAGGVCVVCLSMLILYIQILLLQALGHVCRHLTHRLPPPPIAMLSSLGTLSTTSLIRSLRFATGTHRSIIWFDFSYRESSTDFAWLEKKGNGKTKDTEKLSWQRGRACNAKRFELGQPLSPMFIITLQCVKMLKCATCNKSPPPTIPLPPTALWAILSLCWRILRCWRRFSQWFLTRSDTVLTSKNHFR